uniref:Uncharacterized protein n=1 Tax=Triticum aestivum TaxID=4565 RepID=A0A077S0J9_WHEAT|nr:unnamed protein product [Triticum aestivum]
MMNKGLPPHLPCSSTPVRWERCPRCFLPRSPATLLLRPTTGLPCSSTPTVKTQLRCYSSIFLRHPSSPADVTLLFKEKPACGRIRQDPVEGDEERRRWAEEKEEKGRGGGGRDQERRRDEAWGLEIEDGRGLAARFSPDSTAHRTYGTLRFLLNVAVKRAREKRSPTRHSLKHERSMSKKTNRGIFDSTVKSGQRGRSCGQNACAPRMPLEWRDATSITVVGPLWTGPLHDCSSITKMLNLAVEWGRAHTSENGVEKLLGAMIEESDPRLPPGYIRLDEIACREKVNSPPLGTLIHSLQKFWNILNVNRKVKLLVDLI